MRPILVNSPAKALFIAALVLAAAAFLRDLWRRRRDPTQPLSATPLYLLLGAELLIGLKSGSWTPTVAGFQHPWTPVPIYAYGVMLGTSLIVGWFLVMRFAKQDGIAQEAAATIYMWSAVWSIIGSRLLWYLTTPNVPLSEIVFVNRGGLVAYGGMISGFLATWYMCHKRKIPLLRWADVAAPSVVLGTAITRMGCLLFGCDFGARSDLPWAVRFPAGSPAWKHHVDDLGLDKAAGWSYSVHPTQIYEALVGLSLFALLMILRRYRRFSGQVFLGWVLGYGLMRPIIEIFRDDEDRGLYTLPFGNLALSTSQIIGIVSFVLGLWLLSSLWRRYRRDPESLRLWMQPAVAGGPPPIDAPSGAKTHKRRKRK
ncbi:MAG TPA: prolipoprotein diacylglyceryl transferase [Polyangia bacterium]|nr:prolipoprotein diacylglyceryl transferase [Polyangia bacterium]